MEEDYACLKHLNGKLVHLEEWIYAIGKNSNDFGQDLQNNQWPNNLNRQLEDSTYEDESPSIVYKPIDNKEETFQILVDGNERIHGNPFKPKPKKKKVRFSEHHELSDEGIINEIEKDLRIMEERDKNLKDTYHISFLDRPLNNQEPYEWQLENPEFIQQPPNEEDETESILENEYNYIYLPYITFEDIYGDEAQERLCEDKDLCHLPGANLNKIQFLEVLAEEGIQGNLSNQFWDKTFEMQILPRRGLYFNQIWAQWYLGLNGSTYQTGRLKRVGDGYIFIDEDLWWSEFPSEPEIEERNAFVEALKDLILARLLNRHSPFPPGGAQL
ncbi:hypothetical protein O181_107542 [Austropuccinia psidii MF-1]|uniref:Uncharacterized protein n=1 Tax=Austropuccinia psidii MF-1 TaxID=1389203 RepID=A0A9Q3JU63_9BASI|nr:hypothetical protein [Austropuccinia psidii MF-1]